MDEVEQIERLRAVVGRFFELRQTTLLGAPEAPFDIGKPNIHDSKSEFLEEKQAVENALSQATGLVRFLTAQYDVHDPVSEISARVCGNIDQRCRSTADGLKFPSSADLIYRCARTQGLSIMTAFLLLDFKEELSVRKQELEDQERDFGPSEVVRQITTPISSH